MNPMNLTWIVGYFPTVTVWVEVGGRLGVCIVSSAFFFIMVFCIQVMNGL